jgi:chorismate mutase
MVYLCLLEDKVEKRLYAGRAAVQLETDSKDQMLAAVKTMAQLFFDTNPIDQHEYVSIQFTLTSDLTSFNPATAFRANFPTLTVPLFCAVEPPIQNSMKRMVRMLIYFYGPSDYVVKHAYVGEAALLRPDLPHSP